MAQSSDNTKRIQCTSRSQDTVTSIKASGNQLVEDRYRAFFLLVETLQDEYVGIAVRKQLTDLIFIPYIHRRDVVAVHISDGSTECTANANKEKKDYGKELLHFAHCFMISTIRAVQSFIASRAAHSDRLW